MGYTIPGWMKGGREENKGEVCWINILILIGFYIELAGFHWLRLVFFFKNPSSHTRSLNL